MSSASRDGDEPAVTSWERPDPRTALSVAETARRAGRAVWIEQTLFEVLGAWVAVTPEAHVKQRFATQSHHHAWHAELWRSRQPELQELPPTEAIDVAGAALAELAAALTATTDAAATVERLVAVYRVVLPRCVEAYTQYLHTTSRVTDAPTARVLDLVLADEVDDWRTGEFVLQSMLTTPDAVRRAADHQAHVESLVVAAGGLMGVAV